MATMPSVKVIKSFTYKQAAKRFSNRYYFDNASPTTSGRWDQLMDNIVTAEKAIYPNTVHIVACIGYDAGSEMPVHSKTYSTAGTYAIAAGDVQAPGNTTALIRYSTTQRTTKNHPIYLFNYYHGTVCDTHAADGQDFPPGSLSTLYAAYANTWVGGISDGTLNHKRAGPRGAVAQGYFVEDYLTHRDFHD